MFTVGTIADIHLRGGRDTDEAKALRQAAAVFASHNVEVVLVGGDVYHAKSTPEQRMVFLEFVLEMTRNGARVIIIRGNHDEAGDLELFGALDDVFVHEEPGELLIPIRSGSFDLQVLTLPHFNASKVAFESESLERMGETGSNLFEDIIEGYRQDIARHGGPSMILGHAVVSEAKLDNGMIPKQDGIVLNGPLLASLGVPVRVGHYHTHQEVFPNVVYPGSPNYQNFGESGDKGVYIDVFEGGQHVKGFLELLNPTKRITLDAEWQLGSMMVPLGEPGPNGERTMMGIGGLNKADYQGAKVRFRYRVKQSDLERLDLEPVRQFFEEAGVEELKLERDLIVESALRSEGIIKATSVLESHEEWLKSKGLELRVPTQKQLYNEVCGDGASAPGEVREGSIPSPVEGSPSPAVVRDCSPDRAGEGGSSPQTGVAASSPLDKALEEFAQATASEIQERVGSPEPSPLDSLESEPAQASLF